MLSDIIAARDAALASIDSASTLDEVNELASRLTGKKGELAQLKTGSGRSSRSTTRSPPARAINEAIAAVTEALERRRALLGDEALGARIESRASRPHRVRRQPEARSRPPRHPGLGTSRGHVHRPRLPDRRGPRGGDRLAQLRGAEHGGRAPGARRVRHAVRRPVPPGGQAGTTLLRTHTSPVQIRTKYQSRRSTSSRPGRVFRRDTPDATHMPVFHQIEGLVIDRDITWPTWPARSGVHEGVLRAGLHVAPAAELFPVHRTVGEFDIRGPTASGSSSAAAAWCTQRVACRRARPREWSGFAFGFGIDRMAKERTASTTSVTCSPTTSASWSSSERSVSAAPRSRLT